MAMKHGNESTASDYGRRRAAEGWVSWGLLTAVASFPQLKRVELRLLWETSAIYPVHSFPSQPCSVAVTVRAAVSLSRRFVGDPLVLARS